MGGDQFALGRATFGRKLHWNGSSLRKGDDVGGRKIPKSLLQVFLGLQPESEGRVMKSFPLFPKYGKAQSRGRESERAWPSE